MIVMKSIDFWLSYESSHMIVFMYRIHTLSLLIISLIKPRHFPTLENCLHNFGPNHVSENVEKK